MASERAEAGAFPIGPCVEAAEASPCHHQAADEQMLWAGAVPRSSSAEGDPAEKCRKAAGPWDWAAFGEWHWGCASAAGFDFVERQSYGCHSGGRASCRSSRIWTLNRCPYPCPRHLEFWVRPTIGSDH